MLLAATAEDTADLGGRLALAVCNATEAGCLIAMSGSLGAGKTTLVRGFLRRLGHEGRVPSPTYTLMEPYAVGDRNIIHMDLYRLEGNAEVEGIGWRDTAEADSIVLVEWPEHAPTVLQHADLALHIEAAQPGRRVRFRAVSALGERILSNLS